MLKRMPFEFHWRFSKAPFNELNFHSTLLVYLALILTFGVTFPPLAVTLGFATVSIVYFTRYRLGRLVDCAIDVGQLQYIDLIEKGCTGIGATSLTSIMWALVTISSLFYTLFLFDTLGDSVGFSGAYWVLIIVPLTPLWMYSIAWGYDKYICLLHVPCDESRLSDRGVSMTVFSGAECDAIDGDGLKEHERNNTSEDASCNPMVSNETI
jgi:hypothetical protein